MPKQRNPWNWSGKKPAKKEVPVEPVASTPDPEAPVKKKAGRPKKKAD